jgi:hypothetical protein
MVILIINVGDIFTGKFERDAPVPTYLDGPSTSPVTIQFMEIQTQQSHISWARRSV